jgi:TonB family protein
LVGTTVVLGSLAVGYLVFLGGNDDSSGDAQFAQASMAAPTSAPVPVPVPVVEEEPFAPEVLPEPPPLDDTTSPVDPSASVKSNPPDVAPVKIASAPPKPQPRAATPPPKTEQVRRPETDRAAAAAVQVATPPPPTKPETTPKTEAAPTSASPSTESVAAPEPVPVPQATTPPQPKATLRPEPSTRTPAAEQTAPPAAPVFEKAEPQPVVAPPVATAPVVVPPEVLQRVEPSYSAKAVKGLDNPAITLRVLVDQQGKIARVLVEEGIPGSELEGAAISAVLRWRFRPATEDGVPVKAWTNVRFVFQN